MVNWTKGFTWVWKIMILSRCLDAKRSQFVVMRDKWSIGWQDIVVDNKFHCLKQINSLKCLNILTMHWQHTSLNSGIIFLNIVILLYSIEHNFFQVPNREIFKFEIILVFRSHISLSIVFNLTTWLYIYTVMLIWI